MTHRLTTPAAAALAVAGVLGLAAACGSVPLPIVTPSPVALPTLSATPATPDTSPASPSASEPSVASLVDLGRELDVHVLDPDLAEQMTEFASDGESVLFSAGGDAASGGAPDLWRVVPGHDPELVWRNPDRDRSLTMIRGDLGTYAFVDMPLTGEREWTLYVMPRRGDGVVVLDEHPGDEAVPGLVPSFSVYEGRVVWTSFDRGVDEPVSQLFTAAEPTWEPRLLLEVRASEAELWLPSLYGTEVAYTEVRYSDDGQDDERSVWLMGVNDPEGRRRLDTTGRATMPLRVGDAVFWKQAQRGYNMFNWGHMYRHDVETEAVDILDTAPQTFVNYPSGGERFLAWWGADSFQFGVYDHLLDEPRTIESNPPESNASVLRPHLHSDLLVWLRVLGGELDATRELRYAFLPDVADLRGVDP